MTNPLMDDEYERHLQDAHAQYADDSLHRRVPSVTGSQYGNAWSAQESMPMYLAEFIGTMMYTVTLATIKNDEGTCDQKSSKDTDDIPSMAPTSVGFMLVAMVYTFGHISGAHFNPAVTLSVYIRKFITVTDALLFVLFQVLGALAGAFLSVVLTRHYPCLEPGHKVAIGRAFLGEMIYTFALCVVVINVATTASQRGNFFYGVAIGLTVCVGTTAMWHISGGIFNPAVGTALSVTNAIRKGGTIKYIWLYWVAPLLGGLLGGLSFYVVNAKERTYEADMF